MHRHRRIDTTATTTTGTAITKEKVLSVYCLCVPSEPPMAVSLSCRLLVKCCAAVCTHRVISLYLLQGTNRRSPHHKKLLLLVHTCAALSTCLFFVVMLCSPYSYSYTIDFCFLFFSPLSSAISLEFFKIDHRSSFLASSSRYRLLLSFQCMLYSLYII